MPWKKMARKVCKRRIEDSISKGLLSAIVLFLCTCFRCCSARDTITPNTRLEDGETLVSAGESFACGFFTPNGSSNTGRFVGIWYYKSEGPTVVWVANRDKSISHGSHGVFAIKDGKLQASAGINGDVHWAATNTIGSSATGNMVKLMDSGNLVFSDDRSEDILWQSFLDPSDTFLPGMKMDENLKLTSWSSPVDPAPGLYTFKVDEGKENQYRILENPISNPYWRTEEWARTPYAMPAQILSFLSNITRRSESVRFYRRLNLSIEVPWNYSDAQLVMTSAGKLEFYRDRHRATPIWWAPRDGCSVRNACGNFGVCNANNGFMCKCLPGFVPTAQQEWDSGDFSDGCRIKSPLCGNNTEGYTFLRLNMLSTLYAEFTRQNGSECKRQCLDDCHCKAFAYAKGDIRTEECFIWREDLPSVQEQYPDFDGDYDLFVRVAISNIARTCKACGTNIIPYPLSTGPTCGDPGYSGFRCDNVTGQVWFEPRSEGSFRVTRFNPEELKFSIEVNETYSCDEQKTRPRRILYLRSPFNRGRWCAGKFAPAVSNQELYELEINWVPPLEPVCRSSTDCKGWPNSTCIERDRVRRCICDENFIWNGMSLNCTQGVIHKKSWRVLILHIGMAVVIVAVLCLVVYVAHCCRRTDSRRKENRANQELHSYDREIRVRHLIDSEHFREEDKKGIDVPFFELEDILAATDFFSDENKLGQGGFGPVYKGKFPERRDMAVKRLSRASRQGLQEFKNEVVLIAKLQHRNLVRLLGYCIEGGEKILLYEYMPNKSLDYFIFDRTLCLLLNWEKRFDIILGIARGLLYLHQDSRLKIIHRDLKTSNILLDNEMNPKISDFGLARIFDCKQVEATTKTVVGTYGYMSPEYALDGLFSDKSDVFSFGVVVLEIISGKRNTAFYQSDQNPSLLGHAWKLWEENKVLELMDATLRETCNTNEFLRCVNVGLLCVQEDPSDRPTMAAAVVLLSSETATLPLPKQPALFIRKKLPSSVSSSSSKPEASLNSEHLASVEEGR